MVLRDRNSLSGDGERIARVGPEGKGEGQEHIHYNISRAPTTEKGRASYPVA